MAILNSGGGYFTLEDNNTNQRVQLYIPTCATPVTSYSSFLQLKNVLDREQMSWTNMEWGTPYTSERLIPNSDGLPRGVVNTINDSQCVSFRNVYGMLTRTITGGLHIDMSFINYIGDRHKNNGETTWRFYFIKKDGTRSTNYIDFELTFQQYQILSQTLYTSVATVLSYPYTYPTSKDYIYRPILRYAINGATMGGMPQLIYSAVNNRFYNISITPRFIYGSYAIKISDETLDAQPYVEYKDDNLGTHFNLRSRTAYWYIDGYTMTTADTRWNALYTDDLITEAHPYSEMETKQFENTSGAYDFTTDSIELDSLPTDSVTGSMVHCYNVDGQNLSDLHTKLFTDSFIQNLVNAVNKPMDCILKLHMIPIDVGGVNDTIVLGNLDTGINTLAKYSRFIEYNCGNISSKLEQPFGLSADYNTEYELFLPFINMIKLNVDDVINATLNVKYRIDILTGDFIVIVTTTKYNSKGNLYSSIIYHSCGNMSADIPITSGGYNALGVLMGGVGVAGSVATLATAGALGAMAVPAMVGGTMGVLGSTMGVASNALQQRYSFAGGIGGIGAHMGHKTPFLKVTFPNVALTSGSLYNHFVGMPSMFDDNIGAFSGFNTFSSFNLVFGTTEERDIISSSLVKGVYIYTGTSKPTTQQGDIVFLNNVSDDRTVGKTFNNVAVKNGTYKSSVDLMTITLDMEMTETEFFNSNYVYIGDLDRFYYIRTKTIIKNGMYRLTLVCDLLQTYNSEIKGTRALCTRSETMYDSHLPDSLLPVDQNAIICYENFAYGFDKTDSGESIILVTI